MRVSIIPNRGAVAGQIWGRWAESGLVRRLPRPSLVPHLHVDIFHQSSRVHFLSATKLNVLQSIIAEMQCLVLALMVTSLSLAQESCASNDLVRQCLIQDSTCMELFNDHKTQSVFSDGFSDCGNRGDNHVLQTASHPKSDRDDLPSGYYDALDNPISEEEYMFQAYYEQKHGIPYARDREREKANTKKPLSLLAHSGSVCNGDILARITESGVCYGDVQGLSISVNSLPSNCEVVSFTDETCEDDPFAMIPILSDTSGCFTTDVLESVRVECQPLPA